MKHGLKSLANELPKYGRYGDTIVAHINPQEAALLKALGGSGTINPTTGLPEFGIFGIGGGGGILGTGINKNASDPVSNALSNNPVSKGISSAVQGAGNAIDQTLVGLDKTVNKAIPGGWGTLGMVAASMIPGMTPLMMGGLGAINGSGVLRRGGSFNLQGAMMGGAMAYGMASLGEYARGAMPTDVTPTVDAAGNLTTPPPSVFPGELGDIPVTTPSAGAQPQINYSAAPGTGGYSQAIASGSVPSNVPTNLVTPTGAEIEAIRATQPGLMEQIGNYISDIPGSISQSVGQSARELGTSAGNAWDKYTTPSTYTDAAKAYGENVAKTGQGIKNLLTGAEGASANAAANAAKLGLTSPQMAAASTLYGGTGLMALEEQRKYLEEQKAANAITQAEYDSALAEINRSEAVARKAVADNPFNINPDRSPSQSNTDYSKYGAEENLYERLTGQHRQYAVGGSVDDSYGMDEARGLDTGNMQNGFMGGNVPSYSAGGQPRFLSGGGDGMSDSIPANIEGKQEARLADGEFIIPADVVSHLGNGSSKAGAKQLYSMMNKVRKARTGTVKQGKQINPRKFLPA